MTQFDRYIQVAKNAGLTITSFSPAVRGAKPEIFDAEIETARGTLRIKCGVNGTASIDKPNGSRKWYYDKSPAQIGAIIRQALDFYM